MNGGSTLTVGSLFAGIGGFDLGLERAGMRSVWQCEIDPYAQRVLAKHWPSVLRVPDIRDVHAGTVPYVDVIAGGFPCQPTSEGGRRLGRDDDRWLWPEFARVVGELRPRYVLVENVSGLLDGGLVGDVLGDLAALGFDADWSLVSACSVGAPHTRDRVFIVAYPAGEGCDMWAGPHPPSPARRGWRGLGDGGLPPVGWPSRASVMGVAHGVPDRVDRIAALGNALVPQIAEWIGRRILEHEEGRLADAA